ncbi:threonine/homoserine/homoserine lactone efflux protein [Paeniglutamicibacter cryotolerans]|uniref:Threonine/homoserine/homoserine lactone efflux protein n=1 Tax=Paeniglutamicibacter cryotolerans TaxID=670079 RepID=A0A839QL03_9MICC|nr:threonine/homoserine/homoserine lactone efflux protein [Paeniglutamicibacter cryotolerans]
MESDDEPAFGTASPNADVLRRGLVLGWRNPQAEGPAITAVPCLRLTGAISTGGGNLIVGLLIAMAMAAGGLCSIASPVVKRRRWSSSREQEPLRQVLAAFLLHPVPRAIVLLRAFGLNHPPASCR